MDEPVTSRHVEWLRQVEECPQRERNWLMRTLLIESKVREITEPLSVKASLSWNINPDEVSSVSVTPQSSEACGFTVIWSSHEIIAALGNHARMELDTDQSGIDELREIVGAVVAGKVLKTVYRHSERFRLQVRSVGGVEEEVVIHDGWRLPGSSRDP